MNKLPVPCLLSPLLSPGLSGRILLQVKSEQDGKVWLWFRSELQDSSPARTNRIMLPKAPAEVSVLVQPRLSLQQLQNHLPAKPYPTQDRSSPQPACSVYLKYCMAKHAGGWSPQHSSSASSLLHAAVSSCHRFSW